MEKLLTVNIMGLVLSGYHPEGHFQKVNPSYGAHSLSSGN